MESTYPAAQKKRILDMSVEVAIRLTAVAVVALWCLEIFQPFILPIVWAIILAVALAKPFGKLAALVGGRRGIAATIFALAAIGAIVVPTFLVVDSVAQSTMEVGQQLEAETLRVPPARESVRDWPLVGDRIYDAWNLAATNLDAAVARFTPQIRALGRWLLEMIRGLLGSLLTTILALIIAAFMLAYAEGGVKLSRSTLRRLGGEQGAGMVTTIGATIRSVTLGVLGIALVQATMGGLGMALVHVPAWGLWTLLILFFAVLQLPPLIVLGPIILWAFSAIDNVAIVLVFTAWSLLVSVSDTFLKPLFLGRGLSIPMPVILIGAIGGLIMYGLIGLFVGAVVLAVGYELFRAWMQEGGEMMSTAGAPAVAPTEAAEGD